MYKKLLLTLLTSTFILSAQAMKNEKDDDFFENYTLDRSGNVIPKTNYNIESNFNKLLGENVQKSNLNSSSSSGSDYAEIFKDLKKFHDHIGNINHSDSNWEILKETLKGDYWDYISGYASNLLSDTNSDFYEKVSSKKHIKQSVQDILSQIHALAIIAYDKNALEAKKFPINVIGTYQHTFCSTFLNYIKSKGHLNFLEIERSYLAQQPVTGGKGSVRPDVYWPDIGHVFDFKFADAYIKEDQREGWVSNLPIYKGYSEIAEN